MSTDGLSFTTRGRRVAHKTKLFDVCEVDRVGPTGQVSTFVTLAAPDWANVVAVVPDHGVDCFVMVRQYRHGSERLLWEFPGGMVEPGEDPGSAALREFEEETGWTASGVHLLGQANSNPAFLTNRVWTYLAEDVRPRGDRKLDEHEFVQVGLRPVDEVRRLMGSGDYDHGIMMMALWWWANRT